MVARQAGLRRERLARPQHALPDLLGQVLGEVLLHEVGVPGTGNLGQGPRPGAVHGAHPAPHYLHTNPAIAANARHVIRDVLTGMITETPLR
nr:hypothetical protein [Nonomuraea basaltis]